MFIFICLALSFFTTIPLETKVGCMDNSRHGYLCNDGPEICKTRLCDNKEWHAVPCTCPCPLHARQKDGYCIHCGHRSLPEPLALTYE